MAKLHEVCYNPAMKPERENQPQSKVILLMPNPDIALPDHVAKLKATLQEEKSLVHEDESLMISRDEHRNSDSWGGSDKYCGAFYACDKKSGLSNF